MTIAAPVRPRPVVSADPTAGLLLILAGVTGILSLLLPWKQADPRLPTYGSKTGWDLFVIGHSQPLSAGDSLALYAVLGIAVAGGACVILGLVMFAPIDHLPLGAVTLLLGVATTAGALWWFLHGRGAAGGIRAMFSQTQLGWYLAIGAGIVELSGAIKALATP